MHELLTKRFDVSVLPTPTGTAGGPVDFNATGDKFIITPAAPIDIYRYGAVFDAATDPDAGGFVLALDWRPTAGSDSSRAEIMTLTRADAETSAAGTGIYGKVVVAVAQATGSDGSLVNVGPSGPLEVDPGEQAVIEVTNAVGAASTGYVWVEYVQHPFAGSRIANMTEETS